MSIPTNYSYHENLKNWDKVKLEDRAFVMAAAKKTTVTIFDNGMFFLDLIPMPSPDWSKIFEARKNKSE